MQHLHSLPTVSLNEAALHALAKGVGLSAERVQQRKLGDLSGAWIEDAAFDAAIADQDTVDETLWR